MKVLSSPRIQIYLCSLTNATQPGSFPKILTHCSLHPNVYSYYITSSGQWEVTHFRFTHVEITENVFFLMCIVYGGNN